jgi:hypothetical protein
LVNISDVSPIFVEVKTERASYVKEDPPFLEEPAFGEDRLNYNKMRRFEKSMGLSVWYAFVEDKGGVIDRTTAYLCPAARMGNFIPTTLAEEPDEWPIIFVPMSCMNVCQASLDLSNKCISCKNPRCPTGLLLAGCGTTWAVQY